MNELEARAAREAKCPDAWCKNVNCRKRLRVQRELVEAWSDLYVPNRVCEECGHEHKSPEVISSSVMGVEIAVWACRECGHGAYPIRKGGQRCPPNLPSLR